MLGGGDDAVGAPRRPCPRARRGEALDIVHRHAAEILGERAAKPDFRPDVIIEALVT